MTELNLQNSIVNMPEVLERVTPDHVHWLKKDQPVFFRYIHEIFSEEIPLTASLVGRFYDLYFKLKGLKVKKRYSGDVEIFEVKPDLTNEQRNSLLFFRELDFRVNYVAFSSTRISGDNTLYHLFHRSSESYVDRQLKEASEEDLAVVSVLQKAKML